MSENQKNSSQSSVASDLITFRPPFWVAATIVLSMIVFMSIAIFMLNQALHVAMMTCMGLSIALLVFVGCPWSKIEEAILHGGKLMIMTFLILYSIGALMGTWLASGTVPTIIYWGLKVINPNIFLVTACLACVVTALATGSSWSTIGTVGVALMGVGMGLGINPAMTAGAIVSGAAFGDKMSPLSDTTNVAPAVAEGDLFDHIKAMVYTTGPALLIALVAFFAMGMTASGTASSETVAQIITSLESIFKLGLIPLIPPVVVLILAVKKVPAFPTLLISTALAALIAMFYQGQTLVSIAGIMEGGFSSNTGFYEIDRLLSRGGMHGMNYTASLGVIVMTFGGILEKLGILEVCLEKMKGATKTVGMLVFSTVVTEILLNIITASQYMTLILGGRLFITEYKKKDLLPQTLSRTLEDSGTLTSLLVPWNLCGAFAAATLGVPVLTYLPFAVFNYVGPLVAIAFGFMGLFQWKTGDIKSVKTYRPLTEAEAAKFQ